MARDLDIKPRRLKSNSAPRRSRDPKTSFVLMAAVIFGLLGGACWALFASNAGTRQTGDNQVQNSTNGNNQLIDTEPLAVAGVPKLALAVHLYDAGAGQEEVDRVKARLESLGYVVKNLGQSQFAYETTSVWHRANREHEARELAAILNDREVTLRQSQISGVFEVLIFLGKR